MSTAVEEKPAVLPAEDSAPADPSEEVEATMDEDEQKKLERATKQGKTQQT